MPRSPRASFPQILLKTLAQEHAGPRWNKPRIQSAGIAVGRQLQRRIAEDQRLQRSPLAVAVHRPRHDDVDEDVA